MPTGIRIEPETKGNAGYWANTFILIQDDHADFDIGRKFVDEKTTAKYKALASELFNRMVSFVSRNDVGSKQAKTKNWDRTTEFANRRDMPAFGSGFISQKHGVAIESLDSPDVPGIPQYKTIATHILRANPYVKPIYVLELRLLLDRLDSRGGR